MDCKLSEKEFFNISTNKQKNKEEKKTPFKNDKYRARKKIAFHLVNTKKRNDKIL